MSDIGTRMLRYSLHHLEHPRDDFFQDIRFLIHNFVRDLVCQRQNALQSIEKAQRDLVVFVLFFQELNSQALHLLSDILVVVRTDLRSYGGKIEGGFGNRIKL